MKTLNLEKVWQLLNRISEVGEAFFDKEEYLYFLGFHSKYHWEMTFESFLEYYNFKIEKDVLVIFNDDPVPWEDYSNSDFNYLPLFLLEASEEDFVEWLTSKAKKERERIRKDKEYERKRDEQTFKILKEKLGK